MATSSYCTQADLASAVGGTAALVELLDRDGDGIVDAALVSSVLLRARSEVDSALGTVIDLAALVAPYPDVLVYRTADIAAYYAWVEGAKGQAVPAGVRQTYQDALDWLGEVVTGRRTLGIQSPDPEGRIVELVDTENAIIPMSRRRLRGLW